MCKYIILFIFPLILLSNCKSNDDDSSNNPISQLPPGTQTGENKAGCLVNGKVLIPKGGLSTNLICFYQLVNEEYFFSLGFNDSTGENTLGLNVFSNNIVLQEGNTYIINIPDDGSKGIGGEYRIGGGLIDSFNTSSFNSGELTITKFDQQNSIISGTFWFNAANEQGEIVEVREGRFDMEYTN